MTLDKKELIFGIQDQYDALTDQQKALVKDYDILKQAITKYKNLVVVQPVIEQIRELGGVENVTLDSKTAIQAAIQAYNSLTGEQQELVTNYDVLEALAAAYDLLAAVTGDPDDRCDRSGKPGERLADPAGTCSL